MNNSTKSMLLDVQKDIDEDVRRLYNAFSHLERSTTSIAEIDALRLSIEVLRDARLKVGRFIREAF